MSSVKSEVDLIRKEWSRRHHAVEKKKVYVSSVPPRPPLPDLPERRPLPVIPLMEWEAEEAEEQEQIMREVEYSARHPMPEIMILSMTAEELYEIATIIAPRELGAVLEESLVAMMRAQIEIMKERGKKSRPELLHRTGCSDATLHRGAIWWKARGLWPWGKGSGRPTPLVPIKKRPGTSKYKGVSFVAHTGRWRATCQLDGVRRHLGQHATQEDAAIAYDLEVIRLRGRAGRTNFTYPEETINE